MYYADGLFVGGVVLSEYLLTIIGTVLLSAVITAVLPDGKTANTVKGVAKLVCVLAIVTPALHFFKIGNGNENENPKNFFSETVIQTDEGFIKYYSEMRVRLTESALEQEILEKFGVACEAALVWKKCKANSLQENGEIQITQIQIKLKNNTDEEVALRMWEYLTKNYCSEVLIE